MARITATQLCVPEQKQTAEQLATLLNCTAQWIETNVGVASRYVAPNGTDPAKLAAKAARPVIERSGEPDQLIYASATVRQFLPDTSVFVARELGLEEVPCYSVHATCLSFLVALQHASMLVESGQKKRVLIVCCELSTQSRDFRHPESAALLGDGAAAVCVEASSSDSGMQCHAMKTWPALAELSQIQGGGLLRHPEYESTKPGDYLFEMDGERLLRASLPRLRTFVGELFDAANTSVAGIDWIRPHQASAAGMALLEHLGLPKEKIINVLGKYGNCVSASIPMALSHAHQADLLRTGDQVLFLGSAAGMSLGGAIWTW